LIPKNRQSTREIAKPINKDALTVIAPLDSGDVTPNALSMP
jgi:hypothetical protein